MDISTHTLTWSVTCVYSRRHLFIADFNSHAHVERDIVRQNQEMELTNFNSHAHVERDNHANKRFYGYVISTHTLTWSVTDTIIYICDFGKISTHTLTWSVTALAKDHSKVLIFQLTRSRGA